MRGERCIAEQLYLGLQRAAHDPGVTGALEFAVHRGFELHRQIPEITPERGIGRQLRKPLVPGGGEHGLRALAGHATPDLVCREAQDRRDPAHQRLEDVEQRRLRGTPCQAVGARRVLPVLDDVEIEAAQLRHAEVVELVTDQMELVFVVGLPEIGLQHSGAINDPAVEREHLPGRHAIDRRIEAREVREQKARGIADPAVGVGIALEDLVRDGHLGAVIGGGHPQAQDVGAQRLHDLLRRDHVAARLGHLVPRRIHGEAVREYATIGRAALDAGRREQRALEPAAVLVGALEIQIRRERQIRALREHRRMRHAGIEPDIEGVGHLVVVRGLGAEEFSGIEIEPGVDPGLLDAQCHGLDQLGHARVYRTGLAVHEERDRHAPGALARDAPVRAVLDHALDAGASPRRHELHGRQRFACAIEQPGARHRHKPLRRGAEDHRALVAPAMRIAVLVGLVVQQHAALAEKLDDRPVGLQHELSCHEGRVVHEHAARVHRIQYAETVSLAHVIVIETMTRGGMHGARAGLCGDMGAQHHRHLPLEKRMLQQLAIHARTRRHRNGIGAIDAITRQHGLLQGIGQHEVIVLRHAEQHIRQLRVQRDAQIGRQRPRRGGPDGDRHPGRGLHVHPETARERNGIHSIEAHIHRGRGLVLVLDLGLGQRRAAVHAPVHRLEAFFQVAVSREFAEGAHDVRLGAEIHGEVRVRPVAEHAQADEILALALHLA